MSDSLTGIIIIPINDNSRSNTLIGGKIIFLMVEWPEYVYAKRRRRKKDLENIINKLYEI